MFCDKTYSLGHIFQGFLKDHTDVLDDLREALCGKDPMSKVASGALLGRFDQWLDEQGVATDSDHRKALLQVAEAFVDLASDMEETDSLVLA